MVEVSLFGDLTGDPGSLLAEPQGLLPAAPVQPGGEGGAALRASSTAALVCPAPSPGTSWVMAAMIASASATARAGVTEGCPDHQA